MGINSSGDFLYSFSFVVLKVDEPLQIWTENSTSLVLSGVT